MTPEQGEHGTRAQDWYHHFQAGLLLGLIVIVILACGHGLAPIAALDRSGDDLAQRVMAGGDPAPPTGMAPVVLLGLDLAAPAPGKCADGSPVERIATAISLVAAMRPRAVILDQDIQASVSDCAKVKLLQAIRTSPATVVVGLGSVRIC